MKPIQFENIRQRIQDALNARSLFLGINEPVTLINGFVNMPIFGQLSSNVVIGGPTMPMIAVVGNRTARVYYFALGQLIPELLNNNSL